MHDDGARTPGQGQVRGSQGQPATFRLSAPADGDSTRATWVTADRWRLLEDGRLVPHPAGHPLSLLDFADAKRHRPVHSGTGHALTAGVQTPRRVLVVDGLAACTGNPAVCGFLSGPLPFDEVRIDQMTFDLADPLDRLLVRLVVTLSRKHVQPDGT